ncbi:hypothetical protein EPUS_02518 [Endocarpon pusillum Z07020]|uniref:NADAR domain-containing protein n=1 Tax=Endocarpon pusillum (strain Z07020 / HMAS-L-300199) TaxID=1263415 RepID=U1G0D7_ENDPU|nr:uncharacterized protein EPUS_02518 [Endocarpon pusillum Z07020]ERF70652.1 hypothetical protein EPUS_02518 [Endocarpon pusillum Z07020]
MAGKAKGTSSKRSKGRGTRQSASSSSAAHVIAEKTRQTQTHIFFWAGPLSNWHKGRPFSGARALASAIFQLDKINTNHPAETALSSRLLAAHTFNCGEQWLMATKGWLFERDVDLGETTTTGEEFKSLATQMLAPQPPPKDQPARRQLYMSTLCAVLRTTSPKQQKALGRKCRNFDPAVWDDASVPIVVAGSVARAEADYMLKRIYLKAGKREFVEGSPVDTIWGVGIHWTHPSIEEPANWRGTNRLGVCHGLARNIILEKFGNELEAD